jgi:hypothetical protein
MIRPFFELRRISVSSPLAAEATEGALPLPRLRGRVGVGARAALGLAERAPTRLALLGTLPRKRERERSYAAFSASFFGGKRP